MAGEEMAGLVTDEYTTNESFRKAILEHLTRSEVRIFTSPWGRSRSPMGYTRSDRGQVIPIVRWRCVEHDPVSPDPAVWELQEGIEVLATITSQPSGGWQYWIPSSKTVGYSPSLKEAQQDVEDSRPWHLGVV